MGPHFGLPSCTQSTCSNFLLNKYNVLKLVLTFFSIFDCFYTYGWSTSWCQQFSSWLHPRPTKIFCRFLWFSISIFYLNLFPASKVVCLAWKQHILVVTYIAKFDVLTFLWLYDRRTCRPSVFGYGDNVHGPSCDDSRHHLHGVHCQSGYGLRRHEPSQRYKM